MNLLRRESLVQRSLRGLLLLTVSAVGLLPGALGADLRGLSVLLLLMLAIEDVLGHDIS